MSEIKNNLRGSLNPKRIYDWIKYKLEFARNNPDYFYPSGLLVFCGMQGQGKTLSAVQYITKLSYAYPKAIIVTNTAISTLNPQSTVIEYDGIRHLKEIENGKQGVIYFIDEIHLEFNSLESQNIDIEVMIEISQQRKQRKHIVGTSQVFGRMAKPLREQIHWAVLCANWFGFLQINKLIRGEESEEKDGKVKSKCRGLFVWLHSPKLYESYDTYAKMKRYSKEWKGRSRINDSKYI